MGEQNGNGGRTRRRSPGIQWFEVVFGNGLETRALMTMIVLKLRRIITMRTRAMRTWYANIMRRILRRGFGGTSWRNRATQPPRRAENAFSVLKPGGRRTRDCMPLTDPRELTLLLRFKTESPKPMFSPR